MRRDIVTKNVAAMIRKQSADGASAEELAKKFSIPVDRVLVFMAPGSTPEDPEPEAEAPAPKKKKSKKKK